MAVTLAVTELAAALRLGDSAEETAEATRLLAYVTEAIVKHAPGATDTAHNEAARRLAGYLFDQPDAASGDGYANALRNSGAARMLLPYRVHRAGTTGEAVSAAQATGSVDNPVTDVQIVSGNIIVSYADGSTETHALPAGMGDSGVDQAARDAAAAAQGEIDAHEENHPSGDLDQTARDAADAAQSRADAAFAASSANASAISNLPPASGNAQPWALTGNTDIIPKVKITNAAVNQYLVIDSSGNIVGITVTPGESTGGGVGGQRWHWFATVTLGATTAGSAVSGAYQSGPFGNYADADAVRSAIASNAIPQLIVFVEEIDANGADSDQFREIFPTADGFGESGGSLNIFEAFTVGGSPKKLAINVSGATPTVTPDFAFTVTNMEAIIVRIGVWA